MDHALPGRAARPDALIAALGLARAGNLGLVALAIILVIWAIPRSYGLENKSNAADLRNAVTSENLMREGDLVISMQPEQGPLAYHLEDLGGAPDLKFASPLGAVANDRVMDWTDGGERMEDATVEKNLAPLVACTCPSAGGSSSCIPSRPGRIVGRALDAAGQAPVGTVGRLADAERGPRAGCSGAPELSSRHADRRPRRALREDRMTETGKNQNTEIARPEMRDKPTVILGGGLPGSPRATSLAKQGLPVIVLEADSQVGGIAKTAVRDGYRFDLGGHRFFTKGQEVDDLWHEMKEDFLERPRMSRIYWRDGHGRGEVPRLPAAGART